MSDRIKIGGRFYTLDAMRGIAALSVVLVHVAGYSETNLAPGGNLAVDFFFALSGFVIAKAYSARLRSGLSWLRFAEIRLVRLYPLFLLGCGFGLVKMLFQIGMGRETAPSWGQFVWILILNPVLLPAPGVYLFPLNNPAWSLFFELIANFAYAAFFFVSRIWFVIVMLVSGVAVFAGGYHHGDIAGGADWSTFFYGLARVGYSFTLGVLTMQIYGGRGRRVTSRSLAVVAALTAVLLVPLPAELRRLYDPLMVLIGLPTILWLGAIVEIPPALQGLGAFLGDISYPIYAIHFPIVVMFGHIQERFIHLPILPTYLSLVAGIVLLSWLVAHYYDAPIRAALGESLRLQRPTDPQVA